MVIAFCDLRNLWLHSSHKDIHLCFPLKNLCTLAIKWRSMIHIKFIFVRKGVLVHFFPHGGLAVLASLLKRLSFSVGLFCDPCQKSSNHINVDLFIGSLFYFTDWFVVDPYASITLSWWLDTTDYNIPCIALQFKPL